MNKTILTTRLLGGAALSAVALGAQAQSSVTLYGQIEQSVVRSSIDGATRSHQTQVNPSTSNSSLFGFRGTEDLGGGLSAIFLLEAALAPDTGSAGNASAPSGPNAVTSSFFNRQSYVGLRSDRLGTLKLGRGFTPTIQTLINANAIRPSYNTGLTTVLASQGLANDYYASNMVRYESPTFAGLSVRGHYSFGEVPVGGRGGNTYGLAATYVQSFLTFTGGHHVDKDQVGNHISWNDLTASADLGSFKLTAGIEKLNVPAAFQSGAASVYRDSRMRVVGASYRATDALTLSAQLASVNFSAGNTSSQQRVFTAHYALSRRTSVYAIASGVRSGPVGIAVANGFTAVANASARGYGLGVLHSF